MVGHQHGVFRSGHFDIIERDVLHKLCCVEALLVARPDEIVERHAGNRNDRRSIHVCIIEAVKEVDSARSSRADADAELAGVFCEPRSHEGGRLLVPYPDIFDPILAFP